MGKFKRACVFVAVTACLVGGLVAAEPAAAVAMALNVTTTADSSTTSPQCISGDKSIPVPLSLRDALCLADNFGAAATVNVPGGVYLLANGQLKVGKAAGQNITIQGSGAGSTVIDGQNLSRVLDVDDLAVGGISATVDGVTIRNGNDSGFGGAGIIAGSVDSPQPDTLVISNSVITANHSGGSTPDATNEPGGGVQFLGGSLTITNTTFSNNTSSSSAGSAVAYQAMNVSPSESFTMTGSTVTGNSVTNTSGPGVANGGAVVLGGTPATSMTVQNVTFTNNTGTGTAGPVRGAALRLDNGTLSLTGSRFVNNSVTGQGTGGAVEIASGTATLHGNRIVGNTSPVGSAVNQTGGTVDATQNWWGCNAGPGNAGCDGATGAVTTSPRLVLTATAAPSIGFASTTTVTGDLRHDSLGATVAGALPGLDGVTLSFGSVLPSGATCLPGSVVLSGGTATGSCTYGPNGHSGPGQVILGLDNQSRTASITVTQPAGVSTQPTDTTVAPGATASFTAAAVGYPAPTVQWQKSTNGGSSFTNISGATSPTLNVLTAAADNGTKYRAVFSNTSGPDATSSAATLTVQQAPGFTSAATATFTVGTSASFTITTSGVPTVTAIGRTGVLPGGLSFQDNGNGTATIQGTPSAGAGGASAIDLTASNGVAPSASQHLDLTVNEAPTITTQPQGATAAPGDPVTFSAGASGYPVPTVQWQESTNGGTSFADISGATNASLDVTASIPLQGTLYRARFTNVAGVGTTNAAALSVQQAPIFTSANATTFAVGSAGSFGVTTNAVPAAAVSATSTLPAWLTLTPGSGGTATLTGTPPVGAGGTYTFTLHADNGIDPAADQTFTLTVDEAPHISSANSATFTVGSSNSFVVATDRGFPVPALAKTGVLPSGLTLADNGNGTATLSGTPASGTGGVYPISLTAANGIAPNSTQSFTLTVREAPTVTSADHATFAVGAAGSFTVTTTAGTPAATTLTESGTLPSGVSFTDNGDGTATLGGTPALSTQGVYAVTVKADNGVGTGTTQSFTLTVNAVPAIISGDHATFTAGTAGSFAVATAPGFPATTALTVTGALPSGVSFVDNGTGTATLAGSPATGTGGTYPVVIKATNTTGQSTQPFTLTVREAPTVTSADHATFAVGAAGSFTVTTTAGTPAATTLTESGTLPSGVSFTDNGDGTATLAGTPATGTGAAYSLTITAENSAGLQDVQTFLLTATELPVITTADEATFTVGAAGTFGVTTISGFPPDTVLTETGGLPSGVTLTDNGNGTATLAGTPGPGTGGSYALTITATNNVGHTDQSFTLTVLQASAITSADHATFTVGTAGEFTITTTGVPDAALSESGALPSGVTFTDNGDGTATLAGIPATATGGPFPITIDAVNGVQPSGSQAFTLTVNEAPAVTSATSTTFGSGVVGTFTVTSRGYPVPTLDLTGSLPGGVSFLDNGDGTGTLSGTPVANSAGDYPVTITAGNGIGADANVAFTLTVTTAPQTITFTSAVPGSAVVGQTYDVTATGGASGNSVTFAVDASATSICSISGDTVTLEHPGACVIDAHQDGNAQYAPASATQTVSVTKASTSTTVSVQPTTITAAVTPVAPGAGTATGTVTFSVDGAPVGTATLVGGVATLAYPVPAGKARTVAAVYNGDEDFGGSVASTARHDPTISATVSSTSTRTVYGWYRSAVTVTFHCTTNGAPLTGACPAAVRFTDSGAGQSVTRSITATNGGATSVTVKGVNIDLVRPTVAISGVRNGAVYSGGAPAAKCVGKDALSGVASCRLTRSTSGARVTVTATATDRAGITASTRATYTVLAYFVQGASYRNGAFVLREGHTYTLVALTSSASRPRLYDAAPAGQTPHPADNLMHRAGSQYGLHRYTIAVHIDRGLGRYTYWNLGVKVGSAMHLVKIHPVR